MFREITFAIFFFSYLRTGTQSEISNITPPQLLGEPSEAKQYHAGDNFTLECECDRPIFWVYPETALNPEEAESMESEEEVHISYSKRNGKYHSTLSVYSANYMLTGHYYCVVNETSEYMTQEENMAKTYVYVKDENHLLAVNEFFPLVPAYQYKPAIIPCRPTSPEVEVTLWRDNEEMTLGIQESFMTVTYDPTKGFTLDPINTSDSGTYDCKATMKDITQIYNIHLEILKHSDYIQRPSINNSVVHPVKAGSTLYLECVGMADTGIKFSIRWITPDKEVLQSNRAKESGTLRHGTCARIRHECFMKSLTIRDVQISDAGNYTCLVTDHNNNTNYDSQEIKIHEPGTDFINLTADVLTINVVAGALNVTWVLHVEASSHPTFKWFNQEGEDIIAQNNMHKYNMTVKKGYQEVVLTIYNIKITDAGIYEFHAYNGNVSKQQNLTIIVRDKPAVTCEGNQALYYQLGTNYAIDCKVVGFPVPKVKWFYMDCDIDSCSDSSNTCSDSNFKAIENDSNLTASQNAYTSTLKWTVTKPGQLKCQAENSEGSSNEIVSLLVTDIPDGHGFHIWGKPEKIVAGDTVKLQCGAIRHNYTRHLIWYQNRAGYQKEYVVEDIPDVQLVGGNDTSYSYRSELLLLNVALGSDANYTCVAVNCDGVREYREEVITVLAPKRPQIISTNMNGTDLMVNTGGSVKFFCKSSGLPEPTVEWYKDDKLVSNNSHISTADRDTLFIHFAMLEDEGKYRCDVSNRLGKVSKYLNLKFQDKPGLNIGLVSGIAVCGIVLVILIAILILKIRKEKRLRKELHAAGLSTFEHGAMESINPELPVDDQAELLPYDKKWEFPREKLKLGKQLGAGAFGVVMKGEAWGIIEGEMKSTVAVKMVKRNADHTYIRALASELKIMIHLGKHLNVVNLLGASTKNLAKMELMVIVEYCRFGNLHNYLLRHREEFIDQIDPKTGEIDPTIGAEILSRTQSVRSNSKLKYASLSFSNSSGGRSISGDMAVDYRAACAANSGDQSSDTMGLDTEANLICLTPTGEQDEFILSNNSVQPEWRSNYRGDYKGARPICTRDILCWAFQVARGMEYLASRKVMHGDLAARNILLAEDNIVKICDFGLAKSMYKSDNYRKKGDGPLPVKWMAIESIQDRVFSTQSDVWSFGIVLWEFFSLARTPYPGMEADGKLYNKLVEGYRMEKPQYATTDMYNVMLKCWMYQPTERPSFTDLSEKLGEMLEESVRRHYIDLNDPYMDMNAQWLQELQNDYLSMMNAPTYGNMVCPTYDDSSEHEYINSPPSEVTSDGGESSGYLCMKSPVPEETIFSPRRNEGNVFRFSPHLQNQRRQRTAEMEGAQITEQKPMLRLKRNSSESDIETDEMEKGNKYGERMEDRRIANKNSELPSFSNPTYQSVMPIIPSADNYVNMPQQKISNGGKLRNHSETISENTEFSDRFPSPVDLSPKVQENFDNNLISKNSLHGMKFQNAFSNPSYQLQLKTNSDAYANNQSHNRRISDASSGFQSDVGESMLVN